MRGGRTAVSTTRRPAQPKFDGRRRPWRIKATAKPAFYQGLLAELEAEALGADSALARIDEALALARQVEPSCDLAFLHRLRGDILLKRDPADPAPAEEALNRHRDREGTRCAQLRALRRSRSPSSINRPPARSKPTTPRAGAEGFSPTPEMPEIAEAQALLAALRRPRRSRPKPRSGVD